MMLERMIDFIKGFPDVWFATGTEVADYWRSHTRTYHPQTQNPPAADD
jgi:hypothetical protein